MKKEYSDIIFYIAAALGALLISMLILLLVFGELV